MKIEVAWGDVFDTITLLGAAGPLFEEMAGNAEIPGVFRKLLEGYAKRSSELRETLSSAADTASTPRTRTRRAEPAGAVRSRVRPGARP